MKSDIILFTLALLVTSPAAAFAVDDSTVLMQFELEKGHLRIDPQGDPAAAFTVDPAAGEWRDQRWTYGSRFAVAADTLFLDGTAYPHSRLGRMEIQRDGGHVMVIVYDRGADARPLPRRHNLLSVGGDFTVAADQFVRGYVLNFGGSVHIKGEVNRSVVCVGGDADLEDGSVVRGSVVAFGGKVHKSENATVYGDMYAGNKRRFRPQWFEDTGENVFNFNVAFDYNRVTGALPWATIDVGPRDRRAPSLLARAGYALESERWHYRIGIGRQERPGAVYYAGAYRDTKDDDRLRIGATENLAFALLFRTDYRDYYFGEGFKVEAGWNFGRERQVTVGYHNELTEFLPAHRHLWSLFGGDPFPPNYAQLQQAGMTNLEQAMAGRLAYIQADFAYHYPYFNEPDLGAWRFGARLEAADEGLASDFNFTRYYGWITREQPVWRDQALRLRALAGGAGGRLPAYRLFYLGGIGSLPGYDYKEFFGDRFWLANAQYIWEFDSWGVFAGADAGQIGMGKGWTDSDIRFDLGLGITIQDSFRVQVFLPVAEDSRDPLVTFRLTRPF